MKSKCIYTALRFLCLLGIVASWHVTVQASRDGMFLRTQCEPKGYVGEYMTYDVLLYTLEENVARVQIAEPPQMSGLKSLRASTSDTRPRTERIKGETYHVYLIDRYLLTASDAGKYRIDGGKYIFAVGHRERYQDYFWGEMSRMVYEDVALKAPECKIQFRAVPDLSNDLEYSGAVGDFKIESWLPEGGIYTDKDAIMMIRISGYGNLSDAKAPKISRIFGHSGTFTSMERQEQTAQRDGRYFSEMILECHFTPKSSDGEIAPVKFTYFDTERGEKVTIETAPLQWHDNNLHRDTHSVPEVFGV